MSAQVSLMLVRLATESRSADTFLRLVLHEPSFVEVGTVLAAECWLLLEAPECRGKSRSSKPVIVASYSCWKLNVSGRKVARRVLATDIDAEVGLPTCVWDRIGQMARRSTPERSCTGVRRYQRFRLDCIVPKLRYIPNWLGRPLLHSHTLWDHVNRKYPGWSPSICAALGCPSGRGRCHDPRSASLRNRARHALSVLEACARGGHFPARPRHATMSPCVALWRCSWDGRRNTMASSKLSPNLHGCINPRAELHRGLIWFQSVAEGGVSRCREKGGNVVEGTFNKDICVKQRLHTRRKRVCWSSWSRHTNQKSFTPTTHWNLKIMWRSVMESPNFNTSSNRDKWHRWESRWRLCDTRFAFRLMRVMGFQLRSFVKQLPSPVDNSVSSLHFLRQVKTGKRHSLRCPCLKITTLLQRVV